MALKDNMRTVDEVTTMLSKCFSKLTMNICYYVLILTALSFSLPVYSQETSPASSIPSAQDMLVNISKQIPNFMRMVTAIAYVLGMYFIVSGLFKLKQYGEARTMMSHDQSLKGPLIFIIVGTLLLYLPTSVQIGMSTFWTNPNPYGYLEQVDQWTQFVNDLFLIVQFIGTVAFIRGLVILSHLGGHGGQPGTFSKGLTHIIGGIFCINIYQFVQVIMATLGIET